VKILGLATTITRCAFCAIDPVQNLPQEPFVKSPFSTLPIGAVVATANALRHLDHPSIVGAVRRHQAGDWGLVGAEDWAANDQALIEGTRLLSAYDSSEGVRFWIITEWDRSLTTVLLPEDY
jgi:hypothetical protein